MPNENYGPITKRLDVILRLLIEIQLKNDKTQSRKTVIQLMNSAGLTPTEIAKILGAKSRTSVAASLYGKGKSK